VPPVSALPLRASAHVYGRRLHLGAAQLDDAEELSIKKKTRKSLGRILLKGDNITLMMSASS
jgi:hypothetical protein